ncbi:MAG: sugar phosphate nucleotidyltransferase [Nanoarchaeota archaeon]|nr:sugar phosphate nucleotidyltransferase [Nanoarchaeota archaeon]
MKAVILAAGRGKRMGELTRYLPKPLLSINNRPFLFYNLKNLIGCGYNDIGIVVGYQKERIEEFLAENKFNATLIDQGEPKGTGHAVKCAKEFCKDNNFLVLNGDNYYDIDVIKKMSLFQGSNAICGVIHESPERFGVLLERDGFLERIAEKPKTYFGNLINIGLYKFTAEIFDALDKIKLSERGEYELTDALSILAQQQKVRVIKSNFPWFDLGSPEDIPLIEEFFKQKKI